MFLIIVHVECSIIFNLIINYCTCSICTYPGTVLQHTTARVKPPLVLPFSFQHRFPIRHLSIFQGQFWVPKTQEQNPPVAIRAVGHFVFKTVVKHQTFAHRPFPLFAADRDAAFPLPLFRPSPSPFTGTRHHQAQMARQTMVGGRAMWFNLGVPVQITKDDFTATHRHRRHGLQHPPPHPLNPLTL